jgi:arginine/ornithine transport system substrate-binding protein
MSNEVQYMETRMKRLVTAVLAMTMICTVAHAKQWSEITVATDATFPPFESVAANGSLTGYDIDLIHALCDQMHAKCNVVNAAWSGIFPGLMNGKYDAIISSLNITEQRKRIMGFSDVYEQPVYRFVAKKGANIQFTPEGLKGKVIAVQTGTPMDGFVTERFGNSAIIKRYDSGIEPSLDVEAGRADLFFSYQAQIQASFLADPKHAARFELTGPMYTGKDSKALGEGVAIAVRKQDDDLRESLNKALSELRQDGRMKQINDKWFGSSVNIAQ